MASPNTLALRQERLYTKKGLPTSLLLAHKLAEQRRKRREERHSQAVQEKAAREVETGVRDSRSATA